MNSFWNGFEKRAGIAGGVGQALGAAKGVLTRGARGASQAGRATKAEFRQGAAAGLAKTDPAMARYNRMKTNPTKAAPAAAAPASSLGSKLKGAATVAGAVGTGLGVGAYLGSRGNKPNEQQA